MANIKAEFTVDVEASDVVITDNAGRWAAVNVDDIPALIAALTAAMDREHERRFDHNEAKLAH